MLQIGCEWGLELQLLLDSLKKMPNLERLDLDLDVSEPVEIDEILWSLPPAISSLCIAGVTCSTRISPSRLYLPQLTHLSIDCRVDGSNDRSHNSQGFQSLSRILKLTSNLKSLYLANVNAQCCNFTVPTLEQLSFYQPEGAFDTGEKFIPVSEVIGMIFHHRSLRDFSIASCVYDDAPNSYPVLSSSLESLYLNFYNPNGLAPDSLSRFLANTKIERLALNFGNFRNFHPGMFQEVNGVRMLHLNLLSADNPTAYMHYMLSHKACAA